MQGFTSKNRTGNEPMTGEILKTILIRMVPNNPNSRHTVQCFIKYSSKLLTIPSNGSPYRYFSPSPRSPYHAVSSPVHCPSFRVSFPTTLLTYILCRPNFSTPRFRLTWTICNFRTGPIQEIIDVVSKPMPPRRPPHPSPPSWELASGDEPTSDDIFT